MERPLLVLGSHKTDSPLYVPARQELIENKTLHEVTDSRGETCLILNQPYSLWLQKYLDTCSPLNRLLIEGVTIIPVINPQEIPQWRENFLKEMRSFPEYQRDPKNPDQTPDGHPLVYVLGGFAAYGNPSSYHNPTARELRRLVYDQVCFLNQDKKLEMLQDRFMYRLAGQSPSPESWHRDVAKTGSILPDDEVYGGWVNLDTEPQYFSCIPGSHMGVRLHGLRPGFASIPKQDISSFQPHKKRFTVPPGHCIIFPQYILHEVVNKKQKYNMMRLFTGWRVTMSKESLHGNGIVNKILEEQGVMPNPSGQNPRMYSGNHQSFFLYKPFRVNGGEYRASTIEWSQSSMKSCVIVNKNTQKIGDYKIVECNLRSLREYGLEMYAPYESSEVQMHIPHHR